MSKCKRKKIARVIGWKIAQKAMRDARIKREKRKAIQALALIQGMYPTGRDHVDT